MATSSTFTFFPDLPIEIRLYICKLACFQQRNIDVSFGSLRMGGNVGRCPPTGGKLVTYTKPPPILHVNREFRVEARKYYSHVDFSREVFDGPFKESQLYINWEIDRLCFGSLIDFMIHEGGYYSEGTSISSFELRKICLKNGLKYLGWNIADFESLGTEGCNHLRGEKSMEVAHVLPWNHQIDDCVIFYNKGTENSNSRGEIVEFGSAPLILRENKTWLHGIHFNTAKNDFQTGNGFQGAGALFLHQLDFLDRRWWMYHRFLGQETTMQAFEEGREARKAVNRVRLVYNIEKVEPATI
ncbi:uncharacterized protein EAE98_004301 [Botrytis deweyae]|uniref:2EXR domain-containing protein n=1 Tax=Botrytis deweyae TaxID=2478750 RepID=A0ABQ7IQI6_9HELO|nr:uncharacterized protein EAE98_004301 [Botrytis deweyae]KAF7931565.1 hypothetical protein EAE98_004301 [Botrytis deweyae]